VELGLTLQERIPNLVVGKFDNASFPNDAPHFHIDIIFKVLKTRVDDLRDNVVGVVRRSQAVHVLHLALKPMWDEGLVAHNDADEISRSCSRIFKPAAVAGEFFEVGILWIRNKMLLR